jgi:hypothetical protein
VILALFLNNIGLPNVLNRARLRARLLNNRARLRALRLLALRLRAPDLNRALLLLALLDNRALLLLALDLNMYLHPLVHNNVLIHVPNHICINAV